MEQLDQVSEKKQVHYGWVIAFTGMAVLFSCLGLGRFSLGMLLPSMSTSLDLNYSQMGLIGTGNFVGYMISAILARTLPASSVSSSFRLINNGGAGNYTWYLPENTKIPPCCGQPNALVN